MRIGGWMAGLALAAVAMTAVAAGEEPLVGAAALLAKAQALRDRGVPANEVAEAVRAAKGKGLSASEASDMLDSAEDAAEENGRIDKFGSFVQEKLDEGLRGRELAEAIKAEHEARGIGGGNGKGGKHGKGKSPDGGEEGGSDAAPGEEGKGEKGKGPPEDKGPEDKGPDGEKGGGKAKGGKGKSE